MKLYRQLQLYKQAPALDFVLLTLALALVFKQHWVLVHAPVFSEDVSYFRLLPRDQGWMQILERLLPGQQGGWPYRPTFLIFLSLERRVLGESMVPYHIVSLGLHALNLFLLARLGRSLGLGAGAQVCLVILGGAYPYNTQAFSWICAQSAPLAATFALLALLCWRRFQRFQTVAWWSLTAVCFFLAVGAKQDVLGLCLMIPALHYFEPVVDSERKPASPWAAWAFVPLMAPVVWLNVLNIRAGGYVQTAIKVPSTHAADVPGEVWSHLLTALHIARGFVLPFLPLASNVTVALLLAVAVWMYARPCRTRFAALALAVAIVTLPLLCGAHAVAGNRFNYFPALLLALLLVLLGQSEWELAGGSFLAPLLLMPLSILCDWQIPLPWRDYPPDIQWMGTLGCVALAVPYFLARSGRVPAVTVSLMVGGIVGVVWASSGLNFWWLALPLGLLLGYQTKRPEVGIILGCLLTHNGVFSLLVLAVLGGAELWRTRSLPHTSTTHAPQPGHPLQACRE